MTHVICRAATCLFWEQGECSAEEIEVEPQAGCVTFQDLGDLALTASGEGETDWGEEQGEAAFEEDEEVEWEDEEWEEETDL